MKNRRFFHFLVSLILMDKLSLAYCPLLSYVVYSIVDGMYIMFGIPYSYLNRKAT